METKKNLNLSEGILGVGILLVLGLVAIGVVGGISGSIRIINVGEVGVLTHFGEMTDVLYPGIHFVWPFVDNVQYLSTQTMKYEVGASAASNDLQIVSANIAVNYRVNDGKDSVMQIYRQFKGEHENRIIAPLVQEVVKANTAKYSASDLIQSREKVKAAIAGSLKEKLQVYGLEVEEVSITNFDFSSEFNQAIEAKVVVEQEKQKMQLELEKKQIEVQKMVVEQNATATAAIIQADADRQTTMLRAAGEANATLTKAYAQKESIDMIQRVLSTEYVQYQYASRWDGKLPYFMGASSGVLLGMGMNTS